MGNAVDFVVVQKIEDYSIAIVSSAKTNNHDDSIDVNMDQPNVKRWSYYYSTTFKRNDDHTREKIKLSFVAIWSLHRVWMWLLSTCCQLCCVCTFRSSFSSQRMCVCICVLVRLKVIDNLKWTYTLSHYHLHFHEAVLKPRRSSNRVRAIKGVTMKGTDFVHYADIF